MALSKKQRKVVETLERRVALTREFMNDWLLFNQIMSAYPSPGVNKAQLENQFLKIKSKLAREHKVMKDTLQEDYQIDGNTMQIVSGATSLEAIYSQSEVAIKKLETEWHRCFISINETLGALEDKKARAEQGEKIHIMPAGGAGPVQSGMSIDPKTVQTYGIIAVVVVVVGIVLFLDIGGLRTTYLQSFQDLLGG